MRQENNTGCSVYRKVFNSNVNVKKSAKLCGGGVTRVGGGYLVGSTGTTLPATTWCNMGPDLPTCSLCRPSCTPR